MRSPYLVVSVAYGADEYLQSAELMFKSLRLVGFQGRLLCVTDRAWPFPIELDVELMIEEQPYAHLKSEIASLVDVRPGEYLVLADSDMLFVRSPVDLCTGDKVRCTTTGYPLRRFQFNTRHLTEQERDALPMEHGCFNTGLMIFPAATAKSFAATWANAYIEYGAEAARGGFDNTNHGTGIEGIRVIGDQPVLEALVLRGELEVERLPTEVMFFPAMSKAAPREGNYVLHFTGFTHDGPGKRRLVAAMRRELAKMEAVSEC